ncbi:MAG: hypothetical protein WCA28_01560 [Bradyrhizobium sp.]
MRILAGMFGTIVLVGGANAQIIKDPPWNPDHISRLPAEVRHAVLAMCPSTPDAGHYFATYSRDQINTCTLNISIVKMPAAASATAHSACIRSTS